MISTRPTRRPAGAPRGPCAVLLAGYFLCCTLPALAEEPASGAGATYRIPAVRIVDGVPLVEQGGIRVALSIAPLEPTGQEGPGPATLMEGGEAAIGLQVLEAGSGTPLRGLRPSAWLAKRPAGRGPAGSTECLEMIRAFATGGLSTAAEVDLNQYFLYALNADHSVTIINPLVSFSRTKLAGIVTLPAAGADWGLTPSRDELLITMPDRGTLARVDTRSRRLAGEVTVGGRPSSMLVPDEGVTVWVGDEADGGVAAVDTRTGTVSARLDAGTGRVLLAAAPGGPRVLAASADRLVQLDGRDGTITRAVDLPEAPTAMAVSELAGACFLGSSASGRVRVHDAETLAPRAAIELRPGLSALAVTPDGRWGLAANLLTSTVDVFDTSTATVKRTFDVEPAPDQIVFSDAFAYVRSRNSENATLIQWTALDAAGTLPVVVIPFGQRPPGDPAARAASLEPVPGGGAVVAASRADRMLYYYGEGMMAPMGSFMNSSREPLAVKVVDRSLNEAAPGLYATEVTLPEAGVYDLPFVLSNPRIAGCFEVTVRAAPGAGKSRTGPLVRADLIGPAGGAPADGPVRLAFGLTDPETGEPLSGLADVQILTFQPPGLFQARLDARESGRGVYEARVAYPGPGEYVVLVACRSRGAEFGDLPPARVTTLGPPPAHAAPALEDPR